MDIELLEKETKANAAKSLSTHFQRINNIEQIKRQRTAKEVSADCNQKLIFV